MRRAKRREKKVVEPFEFTPNPGQQTKFFETEADVALAGGAAGGGKMQPYDSIVMTPFGPRELKDLQVGDLICNPDGSTSLLEAIYPHPTQDVYKLTFSDGASTCAGAEHLWLVRWGGSAVRDGFRVVTTKQLQAQLQKKGRDSRIFIPLTSPVAMFDNPCLIDPYLLGLLLGDGGFDARLKAINFTSADDCLLNYVSAQVAGNCLIRDQPNNASKIMLIRVGELNEKLRMLGFSDCNSSHLKFVPSSYKFNSIEVRQAILQGLMDTDGYVDSRGHVSFCSTSKQLALDVQWLARSLGAKASLNQHEAGYKDANNTWVRCKDSYDVTIQANCTSQFFRLERKRSRCLDWRFNGNKGAEVMRRLLSVEVVGSEPMACIQVSHPNHLYLTDDFIITHNTLALLMDSVSGVNWQDYTAVLFRKQFIQHKMSGGLRHESLTWYKKLPGADLNKQELRWYWEQTNASVKFEGCEDFKKFDGMQCEYLGIDQVEELSSEEFWFLQSRIRTTTGRPLRVRCTCNPEPGWLEKLLKQMGFVGADGYAVEAMDGVLVWFIKDKKSDEVVCRNTRDAFGPFYSEEDLKDVPPEQARMRVGCIKGGPYDGLRPRSFTFIQFKLDDNPHQPPEYLAMLQSMPYAERRKKLERNWNFFSGAGLYYRRQWWGLDEYGAWQDSINRMIAPPRTDPIQWIVTSDIAWGTRKKSDWTYITLLGMGVSGVIYAADGVRFKAPARVTVEALRRSSELMGRCDVVIPLDPGLAGKEQLGWQRTLGALGYEVFLVPDDGKHGDKVHRHRFLVELAQRNGLKIITDWRPLKPVCEWLIQQEDDDGRSIVCPTLDEFAREMVECLDALGPDCTHAVTDCTDSISRGHRHLMDNGEVYDQLDLVASLSPIGSGRGDPRLLVARAVSSEFSRGLPSFEDDEGEDEEDLLEIERSGPRRRALPTRGSF